MPFSPTTSIFATTDGLSLYQRRWRAESPRAHLVLAHGYAEHSGRYDAIARRVVQHGISVYSYDHRGHGRSEGERVRTPEFDAYVRDLASFHEQLRLPEEAPHFLLGHSMGGTIACRYAELYAPPLDGLLLNSPMLRIGADLPSPLERLALLLGDLVPGLPTIRLDPKMLSHDPDVARRALEDPLHYTGRIPAGTVAAFVRGGRSARRDASLITIPTLLLHGLADVITDPAGSSQLAARISADDVTLVRLEELYHETFNEPPPAGPAVVERWIEWILERA